MPSPPEGAINALFGLALGPGKTDRLPAQAALHHHPGKEARIVEALNDGKAEVRALAAHWLGRLRCEAAVPALEKAVLKEKHDLAKGALLDALQLLGQPIEKYLNREALGAEASKSLAKGLPKDLEWLPWSALPEVRWADGHGQVPTDVVKWMLVQAVKQKLPEPNAVLRKYCAMFEARDREALGQFVLEAWLREDVRPIGPDEAMTRAQATAQSTHQSMAQYPQYYQNDSKLGLSIAEMTAAYLPSFLRQPAGSATGSKGLLAVVAACAAERAAAPTQRYLKEWYGSRASQGKALIAMLAWIEHTSATQLMLAIGSRFRTRSFQEEATRQAQALAERKGWSLAELADRTVPSAGLDDEGVLELSFGSRAFQAKLLPDFKGHLLEAFALRGRALKLGYSRGPAEDGGWFHVYEKRFPTLGLQAVIEFTGNPLPEENRNVALLNLSFAANQAADSWQRGKLALSKVPAILLSECYNDLRLIASEGSGFAADWEKKSEY